MEKVKNLLNETSNYKVEIEFQYGKVETSRTELVLEV